MKTYFWNLLEWLSQGLNTVFLLGNPNMTVSARCYVNRARAPWATAYKVINAVFFWQEDHCKQSYEDDLEFARSVLPPQAAQPQNPYFPPGADPADR